MKQLLKGKRALITGATSGIGLAVARCFAREGAALVLTGRRKERLEDIAGELQEKGVECAILPGDAGDLDFAAELFRFAEERDGWSCWCAVRGWPSGRRPWR